MTRGRVVLSALAALGGLAELRRVQRQRLVRPQQRRYADYLTPPAPDGLGWFRYATGDR